jgi:hypothetical protein
MKHSPGSLSLLVASVLLCALAGCAAAGDDDDDDVNDPCRPALESNACTTPAEVICRDQSLVDLSMNPEEVTPGLIDNQALDDGFHSTVDATAGGAFGGTGGFVYGKFTDDGLTKVSLTDDESFESMDWDISFRRFVVRLNSGTGGPSCVSAARTAPTTDFACPVVDAALLEFNVEQFMSPGTCDLIPDGSGLPGAAGVVLQSYWTYPGCVQMTGNVYFLSLADGRHVKLVVTHFYDEAAQQDCQDTDSTDSAGSGTIQLDWAFLD